MCGILIAILVAIGIYFIVTAGSDDSTNGDGNGGNGGGSGSSNGIHLEDILQGKLLSRSFNGSWSNGPNVIYKENHVSCCHHAVTHRKDFNQNATIKNFQNLQAIVELNVKTKMKTTLMMDEAVSRKIG